MIGQPIASATSAGPSSAPVVSSPGADGAQDGISTKTLIGCTIASSCISRTPGRPSTFATSCGSTNIVVVPCGITARANWLTVSMPLSTCMCPSQSPGIRIPPARVDHPRLRPDHRRGVRPAGGEAPGLDRDVRRPAITSRECTFTQAQLRITRSAGRAAAPPRRSARRPPRARRERRLLGHGASFSRPRRALQAIFRAAGDRRPRGASSLIRRPRRSPPAPPAPSRPIVVRRRRSRSRPRRPRAGRPPCRPPDLEPARDHIGELRARRAVRLSDRRSPAADRERGSR